MSEQPLPEDSAIAVEERMQAVIDREREDGCWMADPSLIKPAIRRWNSYERRFRRHKDKSLAHRAQDLKKGLIALYPDHTYDEACLGHLSRSFAEILLSSSSQEVSNDA